tara:strand:- start:14 stop:2128 length:2115 start_codon:yes stop_codon:yes gene_type:complete
MFKSPRLYLVFLLLLALGNTAHAGKVKRAFEALSVYNYFKAKELFEKKWENNKVAASFGLSIIYGRNDNPFHNMDSAHLYITLAALNFSTLEAKRKLKIKSFGVDSTSIENWKDTIDLKSFQHAAKVNSLEEYERYMLGYFDSDFRNKAEELRDSLVYHSMTNMSSSSAFLSFLENYPNSHLKSEALFMYQRLLFQELIDKDDLTAYRNFVKQYPAHPNKLAAEDSVYVKSIQNRSIQEYRNFIQQNPTNQNVGKAWRSIYKLYTANYSAKIIQDFKQQFPEYPFKEELQQDFNLANELFLPFKKNGLWGFMNDSGTIKISAQFTFVESFSEGLALVGLEDKLGYIDKLGDVVVPFEFEEAYSFKNGIAIVGKNQHFGVINRVNRSVVPFKYDFIEPFHSNIALAASELGYGFISSAGKELTSFDFSYATDFYEGYALVTKGGKMALLDTSFQVIIAFNYTKLSIPEDSIVIAKGDSLFGLLNLKGDTVLDFQYKRIDDFSDELALIQKADQYGYVNKYGKISIPIMYTYSLPASIWGKFDKGFARFQRKGKFGVLNTKGQEVSPSIFENLKDYNLKGLFPVKKQEKWGYANGELQLKIKYIYNAAEAFQSGCAIVKNDTAFGLIDQSTKWLIQPNYESIRRASDSIFIVKQEKLGVLNRNEEIIVPLEYEEIQMMDEGLLKLYKENEVFYFRIKGAQFILPEQ